jgi:hypothetical protein
MSFEGGVGFESTKRVFKTVFQLPHDVPSNYAVLSRAMVAFIAFNKRYPAQQAHMIPLVPTHLHRFLQWRMTNPESLGTYDFAKECEVPGSLERDLKVEAGAMRELERGTGGGDGGVRVGKGATGFVVNGLLVVELGGGGGGVAAKRALVAHGGLGAADEVRVADGGFVVESKKARL